MALTVLCPAACLHALPRLPGPVWWHQLTASSLCHLLLEEAQLGPCHGPQAEGHVSRGAVKPTTGQAPVGRQWGA